MLMEVNGRLLPVPPPYMPPPGHGSMPPPQGGFASHPQYPQGVYPQYPQQYGQSAYHNPYNPYTANYPPYQQQQTSPSFSR